MRLRRRPGRRAAEATFHHEAMREQRSDFEPDRRLFLHSRVFCAEPVSTSAENACSIVLMVRVGARNLITDVPGIRVGQAQDETARTGVTGVLPDEPARAAVDVRGGAPGTRETDALDPMGLAGKVDAVVISGGSAFGLDSASGAMAWLSEHGRGFALRPDVPRVPIVPAAILFDLANGGKFT